MFKFLFNLVNKLFKRNELFFINGSEILPEPLKSEEERYYIIAFNNGDMLARDKLIEHNLRLVVYIAKKFESSGVYIEDLISIGCIGLIKGVNTFKMDKNIKLATYASRCIENEILMFLRKNSKLKSEVSFDEPLNIDWDGNELLLSDILGTDEDVVVKGIEENEERQMLYDAVNRLNNREREIIILRFGLYGNEELTQKEVAEKMGISQSYISRLEKKIVDKMKQQIQKGIA
ncbi:RNA polymerase sporulation sigma factor SigE [Haloplasma contractile]|uniref:RNA polymerase sigma factor n=1 Tax=Haloplasma contractile SSD-17B TaxID=1033810 RepID=U2EG63_9MOLU|nr:RNA polymerase sporulation sigma factor SigE [Haloplasma contractile]ERJ13606.1 RNA polymerase sigma factor protein [Haloplasma contractile SSD-17B]